jgi:hypothetical protein
MSILRYINENNFETLARGFYACRRHAKDSVMIYDTYPGCDTPKDPYPGVLCGMRVPEPPVGEKIKADRGTTGDCFTLVAACQGKK